MATDFKTSETRENLMRAFAGESQARNRYTFAAEIAHRQNQIMVEELFAFTADQERAHAKIFYDLLQEFSGENIEISSAAYPINISENLEDLLNFAKHNEFEEANDVYLKFSQKAQEEGFQKVAYCFAEIAKVEQIHCDRFEKLAETLKNNQLYTTSQNSVWICKNCGYIFEGTNVPLKCPVCLYEQGYFISIDLLGCQEFLRGKQ